MRHVECMGKIRKTHKILIRKAEEKHLEDLSADWMNHWIL